MIILYLLVFIMTITAALASFFLKKSTSGGTIASIVKNRFLYLGGFLYAISSFLNIWILKQMPYSVVVPMGSMCYIWTMFIARMFLKEKIGLGKIVGVLFILSGVVCIAI